MASDASSDPTSSNLPISVAIPCSETPKGFLGQTVFVLEILVFGERRELRRSFEDFEKVHADFAQFFKTFPSQVRLKLSYALAPLPSTCWYKPDSPRTLEERRAKLEVLLQKLLEQTEVLHDTEERLWTFLQLPPATAAALRLLASGRGGPWVRSLWEARAEETAVVEPKAATGSEKMGQVLFNLTAGRSEELRSAYPSIKGLLPSASGHRQVAASAVPACLRHPAVEDALQLLASGPEAQDADLACELLAYIYSNVEICQEISRRPNLRRVETLLRLASAEVPAACRGLLALARHSQDWAEALGAAMSPEVAENLALLAETEPPLEESSPASTHPAADRQEPRKQRLAAEILLRGFDGLAVTRFIRPELSDARKRLLNALFVSQDLSARISVGLLLSRLVLEPGYAEAEKAEQGICSLHAELADQPELCRVELQAILSEETHWAWLLRLVASGQRLVSSFALLVLAKCVRPAPELLASSPCLGALEDLAQNEALAAELLLDAYRSQGDEAAPLEPSRLELLGGALGRSAKSEVEELLGTHGMLAEAVTGVRSSWAKAQTTEAFLAELEEGLVSFGASSDLWRRGLAAGDEATKEAEQAERRSAEALDGQQKQQQLAASSMKSELADERSAELQAELRRAKAAVDSAEAAVEDLKLRMESLLQEKMTTTPEASEASEEAKRWRNAAAEAEEREAEWSAGQAEPELAPSFEKLQKAIAAGEKATAEPRSKDCWQKHQEAVERMKSARGRLEELDQGLRDCSEEMPKKQALLQRTQEELQSLQSEARAIRCRQAAVLDDFGEVQASSRRCKLSLRGLQQELRTSRTSLSEEEAKRRQLRGSIGDLMRQLQALDGHLQSLGPEASWDATPA